MTECSVCFTEPVTGLRLRVRFDAYHPDFSFDLKTTRHATASAFARECSRVWLRPAGLHVQPRVRLQKRRNSGDMTTVYARPDSDYLCPLSKEEFIHLGLPWTSSQYRKPQCLATLLVHCMYCTKNPRAPVIEWRTPGRVHL
jgi:hypothetical protein